MREGRAGLFHSRTVLQSTDQAINDGKEQVSDAHCSLVVCRLDELQPHASYLRHRLSVSLVQLSNLIAIGDLAFREPIVITRDHKIIDGYARWELARRQNRKAILCLEYDLTEEEALRWLIQRHRSRRGLSAFTRVLLALELEPCLQGQARSNQRFGGLYKGSSILTEAQTLDVRAEIAAVAGVSSGNVTKVRQIARSAHPRVQEAVKTEEISIHLAWGFSRLSIEQQVSELDHYRARKGTNRASRRLIQKHVARLSPPTLLRRSLGDLLLPVMGNKSFALGSIAVTEIELPGKIAYLTTGALQTLKSMEQPNA
jgi:hypothetical protein